MHHIQGKKIIIKKSEIRKLNRAIIENSTSNTEVYISEKRGTNQRCRWIQTQIRGVCPSRIRIRSVTANIEAIISQKTSKMRVKKRDELIRNSTWERPGDNLRKEPLKRRVEGSERAWESGEQPMFLRPFFLPVFFLRFWCRKWIEVEKRRWNQFFFVAQLHYRTSLPLNLWKKSQPSLIIYWSLYLFIYIVYKL